MANENPLTIFGSTISKLSKLSIDFGRGKIDKSVSENNTQLAVDATGFGKFNYKMIIVCVLICMHAAQGMINVGFILPSASCDFQMTTTDKGRLTMSFAFGMLCGAYIWGCLADIKGRRYALLRCVFLHSIVESLMAFVPYYWGVFISEMIIGFTIGGELATLYTYLGEFQPSLYRAQVLAWMELPVVGGVICSAVIAWLIIPLQIYIDFSGFFFHSWNLFILISSIPSWICAIWLLYFPETPKYLSEFGKGEKLYYVLSNIYAENTGKSTEEYFIELNNQGIISVSQLIKEPIEVKSGSKFFEFVKTFFRQTLILLKPPYILRTFLACTIMFCIFSSMFTLMMWYPELFDRFAAFETAHPGEHASVCLISENINPVNGTTADSIESDCAREMDTQVYMHPLIIGAASIPVAIMFPLYVNRVGLKSSLIIGLVISAAATVGLFFVRSSTENVILSAIFQAFISVSSTVICCVVVEIYPTNLRATAAALSSLCARAGALIGNVAFSSLIDHYCMILIIFLATELLIGGVLAIFLPRIQKFS